MNEEYNKCLNRPLSLVLQERQRVLYQKFINLLGENGFKNVEDSNFKHEKYEHELWLRDFECKPKFKNDILHDSGNIELIYLNNDETIFKTVIFESDDMKSLCSRCYEFLMINTITEAIQSDDPQIYVKKEYATVD